jgi:hypothetical protein
MVSLDRTGLRVAAHGGDPKARGPQPRPGPVSALPDGDRWQRLARYP